MFKTGLFVSLQKFWQTDKNVIWHECRHIYMTIGRGEFITIIDFYKLKVMHVKSELLFIFLFFVLFEKEKKII